MFRVTWPVRYIRELQRSPTALRHQVPLLYFAGFPRKQQIHAHPEKWMCRSTQNLKRMSPLSHKCSCQLRGERHSEQRGLSALSAIQSGAGSGLGLQVRHGTRRGSSGLFFGFILHLILAPCVQEWREVWELTAWRGRGETLFEHTFRSFRGRTPTFFTKATTVCTFG